MPDLRAAVRAAGALALPAFRAGERTSARVWFKAGDSPVTEADLAVDAFLRERLGALLPEAGWLSEETAEPGEGPPDRLGRDLVWIVDPIDGTRAFSAGHPDWSVSVALVAAGRPVAGLVLAPAHGRLYEAVLGAGARLEGAPIRVADRNALAGATAAGPKPLIERAERLGGAALARVPRVPSLALRMARVAEGAIDLGFVGGRAHDWDLAGADLILHEAGAVLVDAAGAAPLYNGAPPVQPELVAGPPALAERVRAALGA